MVKPGAAVLDVGHHPRRRQGLVGDVAPDVAEVAGYVAPMPGGVGPMTRAMLLTNVVEAAEQAAAPRRMTGRGHDPGAALRPPTDLRGARSGCMPPLALVLLIVAIGLPAG